MEADVVSGPLAFVAQGYREELHRIGYKRLSEQRQMTLLTHLNEWMAAREIAAEGITPLVVASVLAERQRAGWRLHTEVGARPLLNYLRRQGLHSQRVEVPSGPLAQLLTRYHDYLTRERGLRPGTIVRYEKGARLFMDTIGASDERDLGSLTVADVSRFAITASRPQFGRSPRDSLKFLRAFLRFLHIMGVINAPLGQAVPSYRVWRGGPLPRSPSPEEISSMLQTCNTRTACGRRDRAMLLLLSRLGLRAGEVAAMTLDDIDWRAGEIIVRGKGPRADRLPLPADVGEAITAYLRAGRPLGESRHLFLHVRAPLAGLTRSAIASAVVAASRRAGLARVGPHRLRHAAATAMLRSGASLTEVGQVLRHQSVDTTAIYAKVDHAALSLVARPWPGAAS
ncbi:MAG: tyrosine-type recombinase/integrase [Candidatus Dormibacteria bacterium]